MTASHLSLGVPAAGYLPSHVIINETNAELFSQMLNGTEKQTFDLIREKEGKAVAKLGNQVRIYSNKMRKSIPSL